MSTPVRQVTRGALHLGVAATRTPLTITQLALGKGSDQAWPPLLAFEGATAQVLSRAGSLLGDGVLVDEGRELAETVSRERDAAALDAAADAQRRAADEERRQRQEADRARRQRATTEATQRKREAAATESKAVENAATRKRRAAEKASQATAEADRRIERQARPARANSLAAKRAAAAQEAAALEAEEQAEVLQEQIEAEASRRGRR